MGFTLWKAVSFVKEKILRFMSYVLVAVAASFLTLYLSAPEYSKLEQLEDLILTRFIGEAEADELEDACAQELHERGGFDERIYLIRAEDKQA